MLRPVWHPPLPRPSLFYGASALAIAVLCASVYADSQQVADRMMALRAGSPTAVAVETFDVARHSGATGEVLIRAQVDTSLPLQVVFRQGKAQRRALAYPILAIDARRGDLAAPILGYFHTDTALPHAEVVDFARIMPPFEQVGDIGPIVALNGELSAPHELSRAVAMLLAGEGRLVADTLLGITPYPNGRIVALAAPRPLAWRWWLLAAGMWLLAGGLVMSQVHPKLVERRRLLAIARAGRGRSGVTREMETDKARSRLAPLAPEPAGETARPVGPLSRMVMQAWRRARALRNPG